MENVTNKKITELIENIADEKKSFEYNYIANNEDDTKNLAFAIAKLLKTGDIIILNGELGAGKTVFMSGIAKFYNIQNQVSSPTFTIVNEYITKSQNIYHFDLYRLKSEDEFVESIGTEYFSNGISIIEWGNIIKNILPTSTLIIDITKDDENYLKRYLHIWRKF